MLQTSASLPTTNTTPTLSSPDLDPDFDEAHAPDLEHDHPPDDDHGNNNAPENDLGMDHDVYADVSIMDSNLDPAHDFHHCASNQHELPRSHGPSSEIR